MACGEYLIAALSIDIAHDHIDSYRPNNNKYTLVYGFCSWLIGSLLLLFVFFSVSLIYDHRAHIQVLVRNYSFIFSGGVGCPCR